MIGVSLNHVKILIIIISQMGVFQNNDYKYVTSIKVGCNSLA
jgi:hypothetical protein